MHAIIHVPMYVLGSSSSRDIPGPRLQLVGSPARTQDKTSPSNSLERPRSKPVPTIDVESDPKNRAGTKRKSEPENGILAMAEKEHKVRLELLNLEILVAKRRLNVTDLEKQFWEKKNEEL